ncbi:UNKNOWN [Stylonychia lemnae]|uniref:Uncharacterized protein n=1 Tax=Stylonychia lemnae TaxID=5949 RepID=A0A078A788_STYLE|nr:UNKNOWN [Stylonychia lemnae]|eukprot:CDW78114.1 UNKNOWN [Stylonychia lemnae]
MKRRHDDNLKVIDIFLQKNIKINMLQSIYTGQSQYKTLKILYWLDINKKTGQVEKNKLIEEVHTEKDLQRHLLKEGTEMQNKYFYNAREIVAFAYIYGSLQVITMEKLLELGKAELRFLNSIHFLSPQGHIPLRDSCFYTFAYSDISGELSYCLVKRQLILDNYQYELGGSGSKSDSYYIKDAAVTDNNLLYKIQNFAQNVIKMVLICKNLKIEKMNLDFFLDKQSKIWLISLDKCLVSEQVIKDTTYYTQFIFQQRFIDRQQELQNFLKVLNKQEKIKRNKKLLEAKQRQLLPLQRKESIISLNKKSVGSSPSRRQMLDTPEKSVNVKNRAKKEDEMQYIEPFSFDELHSKLMAQTERRNNQPPKFKTNEPPISYMNIMKDIKNQTTSGHCEVQDFKMVEVRKLPRDSVLSENYPTNTSATQRKNKVIRISESSLTSTIGQKRFSITSLKTRKASQKQKKSSELLLASLKFDFKSQSSIQSDRSSQPASARTASRSNKLFRITSQTRLNKIENQRYEHFGQSSFKRNSVDNNLKDFESASTIDNIQNNYYMNINSRGPSRLESPLKQIDQESNETFEKTKLMLDSRSEDNIPRTESKQNTHNLNEENFKGGVNILDSQTNLSQTLNKSQIPQLQLTEQQITMINQTSLRLNERNVQQITSIHFDQKDSLNATDMSEPRQIDFRIGESRNQKILVEDDDYK